jgi:hypothetical protein
VKVRLYVAVEGANSEWSVAVGRMGDWGAGDEFVGEAK